MTTRGAPTNLPAMGNSTDIVDRLRQIAGSENVLDAPDAMAPYLRDWRKLYQGKARAVVRPATVEAVAATVGLCAEHGIGIVPQGGNTGLVGGATPAGNGSEIVLSLERLNCIRSVDPLDFTLVAEAGCILADVQAAATKANRLFPLSLGAEGTCQIGGNIATNAGGINVLRYGNARDLVLGLEVVLADGTVWSDLRRVRKDNTGYALRQLLIGSEGTLAIITAAALKLFPLPRQRVAALAAMQSVAQATDLFGQCMEQAGEFITSFEYMSSASVELAVDTIPGTKRPFDSPHGAYVLVELAASLDEPPLGTVLERFLGDALERGAIDDAILPDNEAKRLALWRLREAVVEAQRIGGLSIKHDVSVPISAVPAFIAAADKEVEATLPGTRILPFGHLGDGNIHYNLMRPLALDDESFRRHGPALTKAVHDVVGSFAGSFSAEHGLGQMRRGEATDRKSTTERDLMKRIKSLFDPGGILNCGKVL
jgi:FAD/FMN-containing dehydrogenase